MRPPTRLLGVLTLAGIALGVAIPAAADPPTPWPNYGHCVANETVDPSLGEWGPWNERLFWRGIETGEPTFKYTGSAKAWTQSDGHSRFPDGQFWVCNK